MPADERAAAAAMARRDSACGTHHTRSRSSTGGAGARQDAIAIVARYRAEAGVEIRRHERAVEDRDRVGLQVEIDRRLHRVGRPFAGKIEMRDLAQGVHAGIGAARAAQRDGLAGEFEDRFRQTALHGCAGRLHLPADERRAVIFEVTR